MHLQELVDKLIRNTQVLGLIEFGSRHLSEDTSEGDYDLLAILEQWDSPVTSLHFYADGVPVDLNFRTISKLRIRLTRELTDLVLEPIGGMWRDDERLAFGDKTIRELQQEGERMYTDLFDK